jgi:hypothetical protein
MRGLTIGRAAVLAAGIAVVATLSGAKAQLMPSNSLAAAEIRDCLCLKAAVDTLGADMSARQRTLDGIRDELARLDAQLQSERAGVDVNNPQSVARFRQLLAQRDGLFRQSTGQAQAEMRRAIDRYGARSSEYNGRCANRPMDPILLNQVQATLSCPPLY